MIANQCSYEWLALSFSMTDGGFHVRMRNSSMIDDPWDSLFDLAFLSFAFDFPRCILSVFILLYFFFVVALFCSLFRSLYLKTLFSTF